MTINAFKRICLKAGTKKASEIHNYYLKIEDILTELMNEDAIELKHQLEQKNIIPSHWVTILTRPSLNTTR